MSRRRRTSCLELGLVLVLVFTCLVAAAGAAGYFVIPNQAEERFGPPSASLGTVQRITTSAEVLLNQNVLLDPLDPAGGEVKFSVQLGEAANSIAARLVETGLIRSAEAFRTYLIYAGMDTSLQAGEYTLSPAMTAVQIAQELQDATPDQVEFNILAGWRAEEIAAALPTSGLTIKGEVFLRLVEKAPGRALPPGWEPGRPVEGYLLPGSYQIDRRATADDLLRTFTQAFDDAVGADLRQAYSARNLSLDQAVTLASIIQREAVVAEEQPLIASVFLNRLADGMKLDSDPTVQYALGFNTQQNTWWTNPLSAQDLQVNSPYNTYQNTGLPPGPISNPSLSALQAVGYPADTPYYYFRAACDGSGRHLFARTYEEHLANGCP